MGTRQVYQEKNRSVTGDYDPTINPGLGSARCPRCLSLINPRPDGRGWTITPVLHNSATVGGAGVGAMFSSVYSFNTGIDFIQNKVKGPRWLHFLVGIPSLLLTSGAGAAFGAYMVPRITQLSVTSYMAASGASHYAVSRITRNVEGAHSSHYFHDKSM